MGGSCAESIATPQSVVYPSAVDPSKADPSKAERSDARFSALLV
jgi:hypothetical protein